MSKIEVVDKFPDPKDYPTIETFQIALSIAKRAEMLRVKKVTGVKTVRLVRMLANIKHRSIHGYVISKRRGDRQSFGLTEKQCWELVHMDVLKFIEQYTTLADLYKWRNGPIPPAYKFQITPHGAETLETVREWYWYD